MEAVFLILSPVAKILHRKLVDEAEIVHDELGGKNDVSEEGLDVWELREGCLIAVVHAECQ